ncbi:MAG: DUF560 domain-containing protein [Kiritimatiellae bacterium]|nr:DUF560 domain-containing protein [Kiritimatiellia bacterium]
MSKLQAVVCLFLCVAVCAAQDPSFQDRFMEAKKALAAGELDRAYDMLTQLFRERPGNADINLALGLAAFAKGKLSHAALAFDRVLQQNPDHDRARLELARTYFAMNQYDLAREEFEKVLAHNPPPAVRQNIEKYMQRIRATTKPWDVWTRFELAYSYDDNVNFGPSHELIETILGPLQVGEDSLPVDAHGLSVSASISGVYDAGVKQKWALAGGADYYQNWLQDATEQETQFFRISGGPEWSGPRSRLQLPVKAEHIVYSHESLVSNFGLGPAFLYAVSPNLHLITSGAVEYRDYTELDERDAPYAGIGQVVRRYLTEKRHMLGAGAGVFAEEADEDAYANSGFEASCSGEANLPGKTTLYARLKYKDTLYGDKAVIDLQEEERHDQQVQFTVGLNKAFPKGWGCDARYQFTDNSSNFGLYDYDRNVVSVSALLSF